MPPRLNSLQAPRTLVLRPKTSSQRWTASPINGAASQARSYSDSKSNSRLSDIREPSESNHNLHISESLPNSIKPSNGSQSFSTPAVRRPSNSRSMSTSASRQLPPMDVMPSSVGRMDAAIIQSGMTDLTPKEPQPRLRHLHNRHQNIIDQLVGLMIRDGKKAAAQRNVSLILSHLRTAPPPKLDSTRLIAGHAPATHLPLNPVMYLQLAIDSVAPILRIRQIKGAAGGGMSLPMPVPLSLRRRRWEAIHWILDAASKRRSKGSGTGMFAQKVAEEIVSVVEGKSGAWQKRDGLHRMAVAARANMSTPRKK